MRSKRGNPTWASTHTDTSFPMQLIVEKELGSSTLITLLYFCVDVFGQIFKMKKG